jgi:Leucine-rich repeat (LRR) protein
VLSRLQNLNLNGSGIKHLPESIGGLTSLTSLDLSSNFLVNIPAEIGPLKLLQHLILPTTLESIPHEIGCLTALETMWFDPSQWGWQSDEPDAVANIRIIPDLCRQLEGAV